MKKFRLLGFLLLAPLLTLAVAVQSMAAESSSQLTLSEALNQALEKNPEIQLLRQRLQVMSARAKQAPYLEDPEIAIQLGGIPFANPTALDRAFTNSIGIRQKLPFFGKLDLKEKIAIQEAKVAAQELRAKEREIFAKVKTVYADLFMAQKSIEILREQAEILRSLIRATEARYQVGRVTQQDVFKALLEQSELENQLIVAEAERSANEVRVNALMNRSPQTPMMVPADLTAPDLMLTPLALADLALTNRPELKGAQEDIERTERMYELAERNRKFPDFMVGWDYWRMPTDQMAKDRYAGMVNITIPFSPWTIGKHDYEIEERGQKTAPPKQTATRLKL